MKPTSSDLPTKVREFIVVNDLIRPGNKVLAAVSGGQDSLAMAAVLSELQGELSFQLACAHFDHGLRRESPEERKLVEDFCTRFGLPLRCGRPTAPIEASRKDTLEEAARKARYRFLRQAAQEAGAERIATGHTRDDQAETVLMRVLRGTGVKGLAGIPVRRGNIIRPLLAVERAQTLAFCRERRIAFCRDPSNWDERFMRSRIRTELLPLLRQKYHPAVDESLVRLAANASMLVEAIRTQTAPFLARNLRKSAARMWILSLHDIDRFDMNHLFILFGDLFSEHLGCDVDFTWKHYRALAELCGKEGKSGKQLSLPGLHVAREFDELLITKREGKVVEALPAEAEQQAKVLKLPGRTAFAGKVIETSILSRSCLAEEDLPSSPTEAKFCLEAIRLPLRARKPVPGDRIRPFGMRGRKKLSDLFVERKIPGRARRETIVIEDREEVVWVVGVATGEKTRITPTSKMVLKITVLEG